MRNAPMMTIENKNSVVATYTDPHASSRPGCLPRRSVNVLLPTRLHHCQTNVANVQASGSVKIHPGSRAHCEFGLKSNVDSGPPSQGGSQVNRDASPAQHHSSGFP